MIIVLFEFKNSKVLVIVLLLKFYKLLVKMHFVK